MASKVVFIIGARPQFIKHAPVELACQNAGIQCITIHTGQHYDENMSAVFFDELKMAKPDYFLSTGGKSHGRQTGEMLAEVEEILEKEKPNAILVYGDTNSTLAGALAASKMHIPVVHVEAGLRSFNKEMPEEINRVLTDHVADLLFVPTATAAQHLKEENITKGVENVGDVMYDMVLLAQKYLQENPMAIAQQDFYYATIHRPYNTDERERLIAVLDAFQQMDKPVVFAIHPRTSHKMENWNMAFDEYSNIEFIAPQSYFKNLAYLMQSSGLITDSGGMQKEAYFLKKQCVTIRTETEWVETLENGWNTLIFDNLEELPNAMQKQPGTYVEQLYGDGKAAQKIAKSLHHFLK